MFRKIFCDFNKVILQKYINIYFDHVIRLIHDLNDIFRYNKILRELQHFKPCK